ncbi:restriction endonuclease subunit S, partial [bacterium]|nr:restriction endonuclease subunit S [bacterium]
IIKETYYPFKITYTGHMVLKEPLLSKDISKTKFKVVNTGSLVFSRINCCRGAIGIIEDFQDKSICTNETHIFTVNDTNVDTRYLQIILRHPYYQDIILSKSTGASLERMRFPEHELLSFEVPVPPLKTQLLLIRKVTSHLETIRTNGEDVERLRNERNKYVLNELGIDLVYSKSGEDFYGLQITDVLENPLKRLDFEHNKPSFKEINKLEKGKYPLITIGNSDLGTEILDEKIQSGSTPKGGVYPRKGISFIQGGNITENGLDLSDHKFIPEDFHKRLQRSQLSGNEVLVTIAGTIGKTGINNQFDNANINQAIAVLRLNNRLLPLFLSSFLNSDGGRIQFDKYRHDFGTPNINTTELGNLRVPLPPIPIQKQIVKKVEKFEKEILSAKEKCSKNEKQLSEMITEFLIGSKKYKNISERLK